jgi:hypothetical protein
MLRHVVLLRFSPESTDEQVEYLTAGLRQLPAAIPEIRTYQCGPNIGTPNDNWHFAIVADFDDATGHQSYLANDLHQQVIAERIHPIVTERAAVQYEI